MSRPVVRGERLVRPAVGEQPAVEPGVGGFMEDHEVVGVVGDIDLAERRVEQPGVAAGRPADGLVDDQPARRGQASPIRSERSGRARATRPPTRSDQAASSAHERIVRSTGVPPTVVVVFRST